MNIKSLQYCHSVYGKRHNLGVIVLDIFKQPFSIMILLGLLTSYFKITIPEFILESSTMLGATATPCALFAIGMALGSEKNIVYFKKNNT